MLRFFRTSPLHHRVCIFFVFAIATILTSSAQSVSENQIRAVAWSPVGDIIAFGYQNGKIEIVSLTSPPSTHTLQEPTGKGTIIALQWSPNGRWLASGSTSYENKLIIWDVGTKLPIFTDEEFGVDILEVQWSPDSKRLLATSAEPSRYPYNSILIDMVTSEVKGFSLGTISGLAWSPSGTQIALSHVSNIYLLEAITLEITAEYPLESAKFRDNLQNQAFDVAWHPSKPEIVVGTTDGRIFVFSTTEANQLTLVNTLVAHDYNGDNRLLGFVYALSFAEDGSLLTSISGDGTIRTWDTTAWEIMEEQITTPLYNAAFSPYKGRAAIAIALEALEGQESSNLLTKPLVDGVHIIVPAPSFDKLNAIAALCVRDSTQRTEAVSALTRTPITDTAGLPDFMAQVEALPDGAIPAACKADVLAVAEALQLP